MANSFNYLLIENIKRLSRCSDDYIADIIFNNRNNNYSLNEIKEAIKIFRVENNTNTQKFLNKTLTVRNIILKASQQTKILINMDVFNKRKTDSLFLITCAQKLNAEIVYK